MAAGRALGAAPGEPSPEPEHDQLARVAPPSTTTIMPVAFTLPRLRVQAMPGPVRVFAENQPVTSIVNTIRDLFAQKPVGNDI
jgi:hypothetical protein